jgi:hypothetical protein
MKEKISIFEFVNVKELGAKIKAAFIAPDKKK